jgi:uncharacterized membrane protein (DUF106 family)
MIASETELKERIEENQRKIADLDAFRDDHKINKIIRVLQKQIARDRFELIRLTATTHEGSGA